MDSPGSVQYVQAQRYKRSSAVMCQPAPWIQRVHPSRNGCRDALGSEGAGNSGSGSILSALHLRGDAVQNLLAG